MPNCIPFTKMEGLGNDYIYINGFNKHYSDYPTLARAMSDRHFGVGSDGLVIILPSTVADVQMRMFNSDGSEAEMCGNASRCVGKYVYDHGIVKKNIIHLETKAGIKVLHMDIKGGIAVGACVDMGEPELNCSHIPVVPTDNKHDKNCIDRTICVANTLWRITCVSMGNPHAVTFIDDVQHVNMPELGPQFEKHAWFPQRINTEFVQVLDRSHVRMRVWERGAGETLACGTGACATGVACVLNNLTDRQVQVDLLGGTLHIEWSHADNHVYMTGPARTVFTGVYEMENSASVL